MVECSKVLIMGDARMVEEVGELELGDELLEKNFRSPTMVRMS